MQDPGIYLKSVFTTILWLMESCCDGHMTQTRKEIPDMTLESERGNLVTAVIKKFISIAFEEKRLSVSISETEEKIEKERDYLVQK